MYNYIRVILGKIVRVDAFYVARLRGADQLVYPYNYADNHYENPDYHSIGTLGLNAWLLRERRTYRYSMDGGKLLHTGQAFGNAKLPSSDAVTTPIKPANDNNAILGFMSMQSYEPDVYDDAAVAILEWMATTVGTVLIRNEEDARRAHELEAASDKAFDNVLSMAALVTQIAELIGTIRVEVQALQDLIDTDLEAA